MKKREKERAKPKNKSLHFVALTLTNTNKMKKTLFRFTLNSVQFSLRLCRTINFHYFFFLRNADCYIFILLINCWCIFE